MQGVLIATFYALLDGVVFPKTFHGELALRREMVIRPNVGRRSDDLLVFLLIDQYWVVGIIPAGNPPTIGRSYNQVQAPASLPR